MVPPPTRKRLIISQIPSDYDPNSDIVISPACFLGREEQYPGWEDIPFYEPFDGIDDLRAYEGKVKDCELYWLDKLSNLLGKEQGIKRSKRYWHTVLMPWIIPFIESTLDRYLRVSHVVRKHRDEKITVELYPDLDAGWNAAGIAPYYKLMMFSMEYNEWLYSRLIKEMAPPGWTLAVRAPRPVADISIALNEVFGERPKSFRERLKGLLIYFRCEKVYGFSLLDVAYFALLFELLPAKKRPEVSLSREEAVSPLGDVFPAEIGIEALIAKAIPRHFSDVALIERKAACSFPPVRAGKIAMTSNYIFNEEQTFRVASREEGDEHYYDVQHGGAYGVAGICPSLAFTEYQRSAFVSWGCKEHGGYKANFIPLPSPYMRKFHLGRQKAVRGGGVFSSLILVGTMQQMNRSRLDSGPSPLHIMEMRREKLVFMNSLAEGPTADLYYRPYRKWPAVLEDVGYFKKRLPELRVLEGDWMPNFYHSRLIVLDHLGTTIHMALAANIPIVFFWNERHFQLAPQAQPFFDALRNVGVFHSSGKAAADHINNVWDGLEAWWSSDLVQNARCAWVGQFAKHSPTWRREWTRAFRAMI